VVSARSEDVEGSTGEVPVERWSAAQAAAVAAAEAIAATAAAEVAFEAAATARAAVDVAAAAAVKAADKASRVAAEAVVAAAAAERESLDQAPIAEDPAAAAAKVAGRVAAVALAAAAAAVEAAAVISEQLEADLAATAVAVAASASVPLPSPPQEEVLRAIAANEMLLLYQPIIHLASRRPIGVEALVHWQHPERGLLPPSEFLDVAERSAVALELGAWTLDQSCGFAVALQELEGPPLTVAVSLSGQQLAAQDLVAGVRRTLAARGCRADRLVFQVTEMALVADLETAIASMQELQRLGAGVAMDDFGTGYSSMSYLKHLHGRELKIGVTFVSRLGITAHDTAMVAFVISLAHDLRVRCVAEGVETPQQLELLEQLGCDLVQGPLFCAPVDAAGLAEWLGGREVEPGGSVHGLDSERSRIQAMQARSLSSHSIAAALNAEGSRTAKHRRWSAQSVAECLAERPAEELPPVG
jgi:EAL domain-containing protein (putative c-di-GMP-specific phosphodiesterase class I)